MNPAKCITVATKPNTLPLYLKTLKRRPGFKDGDQLPVTQINWPDFQFTEQAVRSYQTICHNTDSEGCIPLFFPHSFFGPLHLLMLTDKRFPLKLLGGVHLRNHIIQSEPLRLDQRYSAMLRLTEGRRRPQGLEVDFTTEVHLRDRTLWQSVTTFLFRCRFQQHDADSPLAATVQNIEKPEQLTSFEVPKSVGKRFGVLTRDINPIHMSSMLARLFGFDRDLCHGMWAMGRSLPYIQGVDFSQAVRSDITFKGPLYIGRDITIKTDADDSSHYELYSGSNERPCVVAMLGNTTDTSQPELATKTGEPA